MRILSWTGLACRILSDMADIGYKTAAQGEIRVRDTNLEIICMEKAFNLKHRRPYLCNE